MTSKAKRSFQRFAPQDDQQSQAILSALRASG
jgi:hypothetical protein